MKQRQKRKLEKLRKDLLAQEEIPLPKDPVEFFEKVLKIKPYPYQAEFLLDPSPLKVSRWCRRAGKTLIMSGDDIRFAASHPNSRVIATMPKFQQVKEIYFQGESGLHSHLARMDKNVYNNLIEEELQTIIRFRNKSVILAETPEPFTIRGHGPSKISIDEMNFIHQDKDLWLSALLPMTLTRIVYINIASTPWNKDSVYWDMCFNKGFRFISGNAWHDLPPDAKEPGASKYFLTYEDVLVPNGPIRLDQLDNMREMYAGDPWRWKREMESSFVDDETAFLPSALIIKCQNDLLELAKFEDSEMGEFYVGWDLGRERDHNAVAIVEKQPDFVRLVHCKQFPLGTPYVSVMAYIKSVCDRWKYVNAVYYDHTGTKGMDEQINTAGFPGITGVDFTKPLKHGMATTLKQLMMTPRESDKTLLPADARRKFELPFDQDVQAELNIEQWGQSPGSEVYTFDHPEGSHDDRFWAICMAVYASVRAPLPGKGAVMLPH